MEDKDAQYEFIIKHVDITIDTNAPRDGIRHLLSEIRSEWDFTNVQVQLLKGGRVNQMWCCHLAEEPTQQFAVIIRIYGDAFAHLFDYDNEVIGIHVNYISGCGVPLFAKFNNGLVLGFAPGKPITSNDTCDPLFIRALATSLARIHTFDLDNLNIKDSQGKIYSANKKLSPAYTLTGQLQMIPELPETLGDHPYQHRFQSSIFSSKDALIKEAKFVAVWINKTTKGFCHMDTNMGNILFDHKSGKITLVDSELFSYYIQAHDLAFSVLCEDINHNIGNRGPVEQAVNDTILLEYARQYLMTKVEIEGKSTSNITDEDITNFVHLVKQAEVAATFANAISVMRYRAHINTFDAIKLSLDAMEKYLSIKHLLNE